MSDEAARKARQQAAMEELWRQEDAAAASKATQPERTAVPAGWYPHPSMADTRRYWDGQQWTNHIAPADKPTAAAVTSTGSAANKYRGLVAGGVAVAFFVPIIGFVIGAVLLSKRPGPGVGIMLLSILAGLFWFNQLTTG